MEIGWKAGREAGSTEMGRLDIKPDLSNCCLNSPSLIGVASFAEDWSLEGAVPSASEPGVASGVSRRRRSKASLSTSSSLA
jgi:hypothetical protein